MNKSQVEYIGRNPDFVNGRWMDTGEIYKTTCSCMHEDHDMMFSVSVDKDFPHHPYLDIDIKAQNFLSSWSGYSRFGRIWDTIRRRVSCAWDVLFKGYVEVNVTFSFRGDEQIDDLCDAIQSSKTMAKTAIENFEKENAHGEQI